MNFEARLREQYEELVVVFPGLQKFSKYGRGFSIKGSLDLVDPHNGKIWEVYQVQILIPPNFPRKTPTFIETGGVIKRIDDNHIDKKGVCCLAPRVEELLILGPNYTLVDYVNKLAIPFLANQKLQEFGENPWDIGEYSHFGKGILEYYKEKLGTDSTKVVMSCLRYLCGDMKTGRNDSCLCYQNKKFKECHWKKLYQFSKIDRAVFLEDLNGIEKELSSSE